MTSGGNCDSISHSKTMKHYQALLVPKNPRKNVLRPARRCRPYTRVVFVACFSKNRNRGNTYRCSCSRRNRDENERETDLTLQHRNVHPLGTKSHPAHQNGVGYAEDGSNEHNRDYRDWWDENRYQMNFSRRPSLDLLVQGSF